MTVRVLRACIIYLGIGNRHEKLRSGAGVWQGWGEMELDDINLLHCSPLTDFVEQDEHVG